MDSPVPIRLAQVLGITLSSAWGGATLSFSTLLVPRLLDAPVPLMLRQWRDLYKAGLKLGPTISLIAAGAYFYVAYRLPFSSTTATTIATTKANRDFWRYVASGLLSVSIAPYTLLFMMKTNNKLLERAEETSSLAAGDKVVEVGLGGESAHQLVDHWGVLNLVRAGLLLASGGIGAWTALG